MAEEDVNPKQMDEVEILNTEDRMFKAWGSVEVRDRENDLLPMDEFRKIMPVIMKRGGILMDRHSNRQAGKLLNFEFKMKDTPEGSRLGVLLTGEIFKDYDHDDMIWQGMKDGIYKGLSFGGRNKMKDVTFDKTGLTNILTKLEGFEFSLVPGMGNQEATMEEINFLAKANVKKAYEADGLHVHAGDNITGLHTHPEIEQGARVLRERIEKLEIAIEELKNSEEVLLSKEDIKKPFAGFKDFDDCVSKNQDKDDPKAFCSVIMRKVEEANKQYPDDENKKKGLTKKGLSLLPESENSDKYIKEIDLNKSMEEADIKKRFEALEKNSEDINKKLALLLKREEEEKDEDKEKKKEAHKEDDEEKNKKKEDNSDEDKDKKPEEELEKANGAEGEKKVTLPKVPAEETGGGDQAEGGEGEDVKFIEKNYVKKEDFNKLSEKLDSLVNKGATPPKPSNMINKVLGKDEPKTQKDIAKLLQARNQR